MTEDLEQGQRDDLPLACTIAPDDGPARLRRWQRLHEVAAPEARVANGELQVRYQPAPGVSEELHDLVAAERVCCPFVTWSIVVDEGDPVLHVTAPPDTPDAIEPIAAMFGIT